MKQNFSLGIRDLWDELATLQQAGFYWVNIDRQVDAALFCQQIIHGQNNDARVALVGCGERSDSLLTSLFTTENNNTGKKQLPCYALPENKAALLNLTDDLMRALRPKNRLLVLYAPASLWRDISPERLQRWVDDTAAWLHQRQCTLVVIGHSSGVTRLRNMLISQHRGLYGLASLQWQQDRAQYLVSWWATERGVRANKVQMLQSDSGGWHMLKEEEPILTPSLDDDGLFLMEKSVMEGAPALSEHWQLLDDNAILVQTGMLTNAATLVFALNQTSQVDTLVKQVHSLRRQRGELLKIVVREMKPCLRASDERLLLACGANIIVSHSEPLSRFLARIESVQGQRFTKHVPVDVEVLLTTMRPLQIKGYQPPEAFRQSVQMLIDSTLMPEGSKGVLVALRPVPGVRAAQALTLCTLRRFGDVVTIAQGRLFLFLSNCRLNELDIALKSIFRLPVDEAFSNRIVWSQDLQILAEVKSLVQGDTLEQERQINDYVQLQQTESAPSRQVTRREPIAIDLLAPDLLGSNLRARAPGEPS
ncbi:cellulose biosynthesis protein BcsE [Pectobacterium jejuense]|uniref:cellulose biosynthesis protein BcsE n=1 Tax=Pectobacterium jejuense TaxID=2974022 RepID=UPI00227EDDF0|nr:cellulose biosynthesis protein BcsE [Pectobacterium jejuense]MCY9850025.1 cellulose biosynthesis protein BcsE [Pectobacterium jejuense]